MGAWEGSEFDPDDLLRKRRLRWDSIALPLLLVCATGIVCVLIEPRLLHVFCGMVAILGIAGLAALMLNHPRLIEELDNEIIPRRDSRFLMGTHGDFLLSSKTGPRIELRHQYNGFIEFSTDPEDPTHSWFFLAWSPWLVMVALFLAGAAVEGNWKRRFGWVALWSLAGCLLAGVVTSRRLQAEYHWIRAGQMEANNQFAKAHEQLDLVEEAMPSFADTQRMWTARGRLDVRSDRESVEAIVFRARKKHAGGGAFELVEIAKRVPSRTLTNWAADTLFVRGKYVLAGESETGASSFWAEAYKLAPWRMDCLISHAVALEHAERGSPELLEKLLYPKIPWIGDRLVRADMQSLVGDAYFDAGLVSTARKHYELSMKTFCLPRFINANAQEALLGM